MEVYILRHTQNVIELTLVTDVPKQFFYHFYIQCSIVDWQLYATTGCILACYL